MTTINGYNISGRSHLCTDFLTLTPESGKTFTLESVRIQINGESDSPYIRIANGDGTLHINGGDVSLSRSVTGSHGGNVYGSIQIGSAEGPDSQKEEHDSWL